MFRKIKRSQQALTLEECKKVLTNEKRGVLSVYGLEGYPYGMPINHYYDSTANTLYFHSGKDGHKIDALKKDPHVSFCVYDEGYQKEGEWALNIRSVIVFGKVKEITDVKVIEDVCRKLSYKFTNDETYINHEIEHALAGTALFEIIIENMQGKLVNEA